eukprot:1993594-Alexandrium_andersonii.AAC.1
MRARGSSALPRKAPSHLGERARECCAKRRRPRAAVLREADQLCRQELEGQCTSSRSVGAPLRPTARGAPRPGR